MNTLQKELSELLDAVFVNEPKDTKSWFLRINLMVRELGDVFKVFLEAIDDDATKVTDLANFQNDIEGLVALAVHKAEVKPPFFIRNMIPMLIKMSASWVVEIIDSQGDDVTELLLDTIIPGLQTTNDTFLHLITCFQRD